MKDEKDNETLDIEEYIDELRELRKKEDELSEEFKVLRKKINVLSNKIVNKIMEVRNAKIQKK